MQVTIAKCTLIIVSFLGTFIGLYYVGQEKWEKACDVFFLINLCLWIIVAAYYFNSFM